MALNDHDAQRQIHQMVSFILNEAREKAQEIEAKTLQDFNIEKLKIVQSMKQKVRNEYVKKMKQLEVERAIARSSAINKSRLKKIVARDQVFQEVQKACVKKLAKLSQDKASYKKLCCDLIIEGALRMLESDMIVRCRQEDVSIVQSTFSEAAAKYSQIVETEVGHKKSVKLTLDSVFLPAAPSATNVGESCCGGVMLMSLDKRIVCDNTLDQRLNVTLEKSKPEIRSTLFPQL